MEASKIPVYGTNAHNALGKHISADTHQPCTKKAYPQKTVLTLFSKDPNIAFAASVPEGALFKATDRRKKPFPVSKRAAMANQRPATRNQVEAELRDRNQLLEASNRHLRVDLTKAQEAVKDLHERQEALESEVAELNKCLERNMIILESRNIDPVTGSIILDSVEETDKCRAETKLITESLIEELKSFGNAACEQREALLAIKSMCREAEEERSNFLEKQKAFQGEKENFSMSLKQAELLLDQ